MSGTPLSARPRWRLSAVSMIVLALIVASVGISVAVGTGTVNPPPKVAFVARADNPADALAMGPVAGRLGAPLFTTWPDRLDDSAKTGLQNYNPEVVIIAGGDAAIQPVVEQAIEDALPGAAVERVAGTDRNDTAEKAADADKLDGEDSTGFLGATAKAADADKLDGLDSTVLPAGRAVAAAVVDSSPIEIIRGFGFTGLDSPQPGLYCLALDPALGLQGSDLVVSVTPYYSESSGSELIAYASDGALDCGQAATVSVRTFGFTKSSGSVTGVIQSAHVAFTVVAVPVN